MTNLSQLTAKDFSDAMHKGWANKGWVSDIWFDIDGEGRPCAYCAVGAMAAALGKEPGAVADALTDLLSPKCTWSELAYASDKAGNKETAMKLVDAILLGDVS